MHGTNVKILLICENTTGMLRLTKKKTSISWVQKMRWNFLFLESKIYTRLGNRKAIIV